MPCNLYDRIRQEIQRLRLGVVKEVAEPTEWVSPMMVVPKKDGSVRICVDYTKLNKPVKRELYHWQLPLAEKMFAKLSSARFFNSLDASSGFWHIPLAEECSSLTAFIIPFGRFRFTRLPFVILSGLKFSTALCQGRRKHLNFGAATHCSYTHIQQNKSFFPCHCIECVLRCMQTL